MYFTTFKKLFQGHLILICFFAGSGFGSDYLRLEEGYPLFQWEHKFHLRMFKQKIAEYVNSCVICGLCS